MFFLVDDRCAVIVIGDGGARRAGFKCVKEAQKHSPATIRLFEADILGRCRFSWKRKIFCKVAEETMILETAHEAEQLLP
jgi:hypothetical protein